jgi:hypothetical protein
MVRVLQRAAAANRDESGVAIFGKDHSCRQPLAPSAQTTSVRSAEPLARPYAFLRKTSSQGPPYGLMCYRPLRASA